MTRYTVHLKSGLHRQIGSVCVKGNDPVAALEKWRRRNPRKAALDVQLVHRGSGYGTRGRFDSGPPH